MVRTLFVVSSHDCGDTTTRGEQTKKAVAIGMKYIVKVCQIHFVCDEREKFKATNESDNTDPQVLLLGFLPLALFACYYEE